MLNNFFNRVVYVYVYETTWKKSVERGRPQMTIWRMNISRRIPKATNTHSQYAIRITFPQQLRLHERPSMLRYTYIACIVQYVHKEPLTRHIHVNKMRNFMCN